MDCDELYISFLFPPSDYVSGITVFKRIVENGVVVDVLHSNHGSDALSGLSSYVEEYVGNRIVVDMDCEVDWWVCIRKFLQKGMDAIKRDYKGIYSRSWLMANHFLACEYKLSNPDVFWTAEFSDPLIYDLYNNPKSYRQMIIDDDAYISKINDCISDFNQKNDTDYPLIEDNRSAYFVAEYLVYLLSDRIIFTNENQRRVMLEQFPVDIKKLAFSKSEIKPHPTLDDKYYHVNEVDLDLDGDCLNIAYFGKDYYSNRHFESLFYAVESLNHRYKDRIKVHLYISDDEFIKRLIPSDNFILKKPLNYPDFLNAATQYDVLIVNDVVTKGNYEINPYLPSKLSDYMGSGSDIWAMYEKGSSLSKADVKYKSDISNYRSCLDEMVKILNDFGFCDENCTVDEDYLNNRMTRLNILYEKEFLRKRKLEHKIKKVKKENKDIKSSNSWKITKHLRKLKK